MVLVAVRALIKVPSNKCSSVINIEILKRFLRWIVKASEGITSKTNTIIQGSALKCLDEREVEIGNQILISVVVVYWQPICGLFLTILALILVTITSISTWVAMVIILIMIATRSGSTWVLVFAVVIAPISVSINSVPI
ncbi:hypothetical protein L210DRAFT_934213 [Boletus edulis BED1]|uniref:Uncharacterized protein n=1 Tax=Boletus edulis BED1 TaxID=1328754 RepID=A0AAD4BJS1_BOLED|nr:hypothetical protein L210DRAFT_934213 [Boletus edulis BED1]